MPGRRRIAGRTVRPKAGDCHLATPTANVDAADRRSACGNVSGAARAGSGRNTAFRMRIRAVTGTSFSGSRACACHAAARIVATANTRSTSGTAYARLISAGWGHGERSGAAAGWYSNLGTRLAGDYRTGVSAAAPVGWRGEARAGVRGSAESGAFATQTGTSLTRTSSDRGWRGNNIVSKQCAARNSRCAARGATSTG